MNIKEKLLRKERSWTDILILVFIQAYLWMNAGGFLSTVVLQTAKWGNLFSADPAVAVDMGDYFCSFGFCIAMIAALLIFKKNRQLLKPLCPEKKSHIPAGLASGLAAGFILNAFLVAGAVLTGSINFSGVDIQALTVVGYLIAILFQAAGEELVCRLFIMGKLQRRYKSPAVAIVGNSLFFTVFHLGNPGITAASVLGVLLAGIMFSLIVYRFNNIWIAIGAHTAWNLTQTILFGLPNSGVTSPWSVFSPSVSAGGFFFDTGFGVEGSLGAVLIISIVIAALISASLKQKKENVPAF
ncbi:MAG: CPBP family intramembrane metalloprotease [Clostridiales bacterium]|nr:CPBP family intramembrane metalloprotease [Clostridiales bacterium]